MCEGEKKVCGEDFIQMSDSSEASDVEESAALAVQSLLPVKSKEKYENAYSQFDNWCKEKRVKKINEEVLLAYFEQKSKVYMSSTLWSIYSMVRTTLSVKKNIDIKKFPSLIAFLKRKSVGHHSKKSSVFTKLEIGNFLREADDRTYLLMKVVLIVGVSGALRREELTFLQVQHIKDMGSYILVEIPNTKTNVRKEFTISSGDVENVDLLVIFRKYGSLRPSPIENSRFFLGYRSGKCTRQPVGINTIGGMPKKIAEFLNLQNPSNYTGHCFRRTSATILADAGADITTLKRHGSWKSSNVAEGYIENSIGHKLEVAAKILGKKEEVNVNSSSVSNLNKTCAGLSFKNCVNVTVNIYNKDAK